MSSDPLDPAQDPDRFVKPAAVDPDRFVPTEPPAALDPAADPDRFRPGGRGQTLNDLMGEPEDQRNNLEWLYGLLGVIGFLVFVSLLLSR